MADILWAVEAHMAPSPLPVPAVAHFLVTAPTEQAARHHILILLGMCGRCALVDEAGSMIYAEAVPAT